MGTTWRVYDLGLFAILIALELDSMMESLLLLKVLVIIVQIHLMMMIPHFGEVKRMMTAICGLE